ncbi:hypothetical protein JHN49_16415 [Streptomyces sp. MBT57]|nr:hypothetical protein [Streptomyces sp. MBT57]
MTSLVALAGIGVVRVEAGEKVDQTAPQSRHPIEPGSPSRKTADAMVFFLATGEATIQVPLHGGDPDASVVPIENVLVRANLTFQFADGVVTSMSADTDAHAVLLDQAFNQSDEAESEFIGALNTVPGIALEEGALEGEQRFDIPGTSAHVVISIYRDFENWGAAIEFWHGDDDGPYDTIGAECEYDSTTWWGSSRDGLQMPGAYPVTVYGGALHARHGIWSLPAWLLQHIPWPKYPLPPEETLPAAIADDPTDT